MEYSGSLTTSVTTGGGAVPIPGAVVVVINSSSDDGNQLLHLRFTDRSGQTPPLIIPTPAPGLSESPGNGVSWASVDVIVEAPGYERAIVENVQIFPGIRSNLPVALIPLQEFPEQWGETELFNVTPQEL